jgi:ubiquinone/menaquinone biosynthesis C-methylase UbiE
MRHDFVPGAVDYEGAMSRDFNAGRALSAASMGVWRVIFEPYLARPGRVVDIGSGTGRFAVLLAKWFDVAVIGIEPARAMRDIAAASGRRLNVSYVGGRAEQIPLRRESVAVALLSNVYHHVADRDAVAQELLRVLHTGGRVLIRGVFADRLGEITMFDHFPEAKTICERFPTLEGTVATFAHSGFAFEAVQRVVQQTCSSLKELADRTRLRADTTLALMTDESFATRQTALERAAAVEMRPTPAIETLDLLVLQKIAA